MALVVINANHFNHSYSWVNGITQESISNMDICRAAITVGASGYLNLIAYGWRYLGTQLFQGLFTGLLVRNSNNQLVLSNAFTNKIQTEKSTATYWLSMALTKLAAERRLNIPWLCHVDRLIDQGVLNLTLGTSERGDLAGRDIQRLWHVIEAKGRSYNISSATVNKAKSQASKVTMINGRPPATASACIAKLYTIPIMIDLIDPEPDHNYENTWQLSESEFLTAYYRPFVRYLQYSNRRSGHINGIDYQLAQSELLGLNLWVGLPTSIYEDPRSAPEFTDFLYGRTLFSPNQRLLQQNESTSVGYDGIVLSEGFPMEVI